MDLAAYATSLSAFRLRQDVGVAVLRKERDANTAAAMLLIRNIETATPTAALPEHLGRNINIVV
jgi:hypothetical protein